MATSPTDQPQQTSSPASLADHIGQNIDHIGSLRRSEWEQTSAAQRRVERLSSAIGRPAFLVGLVALVALWMGSNWGAGHWGHRPFDPPPFAILQGLLTFVALITTTIVLIAQNRQTTLEQHHAELDLQVNLLTEQKVTKLIHLVEELRRDLPMVHDRVDPQAAAMQQPADTAQVLSAIKEAGLSPRVRADKPPTQTAASPDV